MESEAPGAARRRPQRRSSSSATPNDGGDGGARAKAPAVGCVREREGSTPEEAEGRSAAVGNGGDGGGKKRAANAAAGKRSSSMTKRRKVESSAEGIPEEEMAVGDEELVEEADEEVVEPNALTKKVSGNCGARSKAASKTVREGSDEEQDGVSGFIGQPFSREEAGRRWPHRYKGSKRKGGPLVNAEEEEIKAKCHYRRARVDHYTYELYDHVYVQAGEGEPHYIGRIVEFFESMDQKYYFTSQWFFRAEDTVLKDHGRAHDQRRVFLSEEKDDNILDCIVSKVKIIRVAPILDLEVKKRNIPPCDFYYDMVYSPSYATFTNLPAGEGRGVSETSSSTLSLEEDSPSHLKHKSESCSARDTGLKATASLLDLYSGCGAMSTGLCFGAQLSGMNLETKWAVDFNEYACESLKMNHPNVELMRHFFQVRNEKAEDFLALLREWETLCRKFSLIDCDNSSSDERESCVEDEDYCDEEGTAIPCGEYEVGRIVGICYGDPSNIGNVGLKFKVRWKGYGPSEDTWESIDNLGKCNERIEDFVKRGHKSHILPLPGQVDVVCGGPPCQGISGFNRFRNYSAPLNDPKNLQMQIFMEIVDYLKPKFVLMENVVDILKFAGGYLAKYAVSRLISMNYQARLGMMAAGCYGLPQFRMRVFLWGAHPRESLPQFPLPTHNVIVRGNIPNEFEQCVVAYDEDQARDLDDALVLKDAISDLPPVRNDEKRDEMSYGRPPKTGFQQFIRATQSEMGGSSNKDKCLSQHSKLYDHRPLKLNQDDYERVCQIPKKKGANFRNLLGVRVRDDNTVEWDPDTERVYLASGKPLVPDYAMSFIKGKSCKPFARLWWDETVPTVVTRAEPHNQAILHPEQDRVLTIRENARLQGFPDYYRLCGPIKERYIQVGNAVAIPVARALGYVLGLAYQGICGDNYVLELPHKFPQLDGLSSVNTSETENDVIDN